jgi:hypothetical protein
MSETVRSVESFAWEGGMVHDGSEWLADAEVVKRFPQFFVPMVEPIVSTPATRAATRAKKAASGG